MVCATGDGKENYFCLTDLSKWEERASAFQSEFETYIKSKYVSGTSGLHKGGKRSKIVSEQISLSKVSFQEWCSSYLAPHTPQPQSWKIILHFKTRDSSHKESLYV